MKVAGYKALLRYEGFGEDPCCDFWCNLCTDDVHAVGWCATVGKPLVPPRSMNFAMIDLLLNFQKLLALAIRS